ncbi:MAG: C-terminal target protein [Chryseobacterium sp.]|jgi:hypothetical protein|nr:C-terminal target protein [Chryseobacterium sp.]
MKTNINLILSLLSILLFGNFTYSQTGGSDIIICLDNSGSIDGTEFNDMTISTRNIIEGVLRCNPNNRVAVVHYGTNVINNPVLPTYVPRIYIESNFTNNITTAQNFSRRLNYGDHFHEAVGLIGNAIDNVSNTNIVSPQTTLSTNSARPLIIFLFTDAERASGDITGGSFLVRFDNPPPAIGNNNAFTNFTNFKNNRNTQFVVVHISNNSTDQSAAAGIASLGGTYMGPNIELYSADPDSGQFPRLYLNKTNFILTSAELSNLTNNICTIGTGGIQFLYEPHRCREIVYPLYVSGNYFIPPGTSITNFQVSLVNTSTGINYPTTTSVTYPAANQFAFNINQTDLTNPQSGEYNLLISLTYTNGSSSQTILANNSVTGVPFDLEFCCPDNLDITTEVISPSTDVQSASNSITANNIINSGATAVYHAGNFVLLKTGFHAKSGSNFHAYIEGCSIPAKIILHNNSNNYIFDPNADPNNMRSIVKDTNIQKAIQIAPNPNNGLFKISLNKINSGGIQIIDTNGKVVHEKSFTNDKEINIDIQSLPSANYIIKIVAGNEIFNEKIIKR